MEKALLVKPLAKIPAALVPSDPYSKAKPPKFHYGWVLNNPDCLLDIARAMNIPPRDRGDKTTFCGEHRDDLGDVEVEDFDIEDEEIAPGGSMTDVWMREDALDAVAKSLELNYAPYLNEVFSPGKGRVMMVALIDNYALRDGFVSRSDLKNLCEYFKFEGGPMWYLDTYYWTWNSERFWNCKWLSTFISKLAFNLFHDRNLSTVYDV